MFIQTILEIFVTISEFIQTALESILVILELAQVDFKSFQAILELFQVIEESIQIVFKFIFTFRNLIFHSMFAIDSITLIFIVNLFLLID